MTTRNAGVGVNADPRELDKFNAMAGSWWEPDGDFRPLHDLNPLRLKFIAEHCALNGARVADVGCGAGILSEGLAKAGAEVTGIDLADAALAAGRAHAEQQELPIDYRRLSAEQLAAEAPESFDLVCSLEMLEHVPDPASVIVACASLLKPGGVLIMSTINRTKAAFAQAVIGAEYMLGLLPKGTHIYRDFIRPSELDRASRAAGLSLISLRGIGYQPFARRAWLSNKVDVNYIASYRKPDALR